jgi:hypothetical protein
LDLFHLHSLSMDKTDKTTLSFKDTNFLQFYGIIPENALGNQVVRSNLC